ncbi:MAG: hypothetical protein H8E71_00590 [Candidatus Marinimicrobia bacterium]|nr:hypothetical protein [Candidatus Neomarinimicrobiota bacterium]
MSDKHIIQKIQVTDGFLKDIEINFSDKMNCIIGARGTGKTTILEFIRYALDNKVHQNKKIDELVGINLKTGRIKLSIKTNSGQEYTVERSKNESPVVFDKDNNPTEISLERGEIFSVDIYSQNQIEEIAEDKQFQIKLIDKFRKSDIKKIENQISDLRRELKDNGRLIVESKSHAGDLKEKLGELPVIEAELKKYEIATGEDSERMNKAHAEKSLRQREIVVLQKALQKFKTTSDLVTNIETELNNAIPEINVDEVMNGPNSQFFNDFMLEVSTKIESLNEKLGLFKGGINKSKEFVNSKLTELNTVHNVQDQKFSDLLGKMDEFKEKASERIELEKQRNDLLAIKADYDEKNKYLYQLKKDRDELIQKLTSYKQDRFEIRQEIIEYLNSKLTDVRISIMQEANTKTYEKTLKEELVGSNTKYGTYVNKITDIIPTTELFDILENDENPKQRLQNESKITDAQAEAIIKNFQGKEVIYDLQIMEVMDEPKIELKDGENYKPSKNLSTGQKCTAILPILLLENEAPLLIDQPEDNLDNAFISDVVVPSIEHVKEKRQLIFITHNPNIPVLSESEQMIVMESDGINAKLIGCGNIDDRRADIETFLEGGRAAFDKRALRYSQGR